MCSTSETLTAPLAVVIDSLAAADIASDALADLLPALRRHVARLETVIAGLVQRADDEYVWRAAGATSMVDWLAASTQSTKAAARRSVKLGETIAAVPEVASLIDAGDLSIDNALLIGQIGVQQGFDDDKNVLLDIARTSTPTETKRAFDAWDAMQRSRETDEARYARLREHRHLTFTPRQDGLVDITGVTTALDAITLQRVLRYRAGAAYDDQSGRTQPQRLHDAFVELCEADSKGQILGGRERPTLLAVVPYDTLLERSTEPAIVDGQVISANEIQRLLCTSDIHRLIIDADSVPLDLGQAVRLASNHQYKALAARDGGCRWPGCERPPDWCDAHHIDEVIRERGPTDLANLALLCSAHHHLIHQLDWTLEGDANHLTIITPDGTRIPAPARGPLALLQLLALT